MKKSALTARKNRVRDLVEHGKRDFRIRKVLGQILQDCAQKDYKCYAKAVHDFCTYRILYVHDPVDVELVESPWAILQSGIADCDSKCALAGAFFECMGMPYEFVTVKGDPSSSEFSHVYGRVNIPGVGWTATDTTMPNKPFGWEPKGLPEKTWLVSRSEPDMQILCDSDLESADSLSGMDGGVVAMQQPLMPIPRHNMSGITDTISDAWSSVVGAVEGAVGGSADSVAALQNVMDGSAYSELMAAKAASNNLEVMAGQILNKANAMTDANAREAMMQKYAQVQAAVTKERSALLNAINAYNKLAQDVATYSLGQYKPQQLGVVPAAAVYALIGIGVISAGVLAYQSGMRAYRDADGQALNIAREAMAFVGVSKGIDVGSVFSSLSPSFKATDVLDKFGTYAAVGGGIFLLYIVATRLIPQAKGRR